VEVVEDLLRLGADLSGDDVAVVVHGGQSR
jgi:hypothetical protein